MFNDQLTHTFASRRAYEIELNAKVQEKYFAIMRAQYQDKSAADGGLNNWKKTANKIKTLFTSTFSG